MLFRIESERELQKAFRARDRRVVELPRGTAFPLTVRDSFAWTDPYGVRTFLVFRGPGGGPLIGIAFRRDQQGSKGFAAHVCDWCLAAGASDQIGLLTTDVSSSRRVGVHVCLDLRCMDKLEATGNMSGKDPRELAKRLVERMARFAEEALGMSVRPDTVEAASDTSAS